MFLHDQNLLCQATRAYVLLCFICITHARLPLPIPSSIPAINVTVLEGACTSCNVSCPYRSAMPRYSKPLLSRQSECQPINISVNGNLAVSAGNGNVSFDANCSDVTFRPVSYQDFTLSVWMHFTCSSCNLITIGNVSMSYDSSGLKLTTSPSNELTDSVPNVQGKWIHIAIRYNGYLAWFVEGRPRSMSTTLNGGGDVTIGPKITASDVRVSAVDARWYNIALTDREINELRTGSFDTSITLPSCRCPDAYPTLKARQGRPSSNIYCTNRTARASVSRINLMSGIPEFMFDNETHTSWKSASVKTAQLQLLLHKVVQMNGVTLKDLSGTQEISIELREGTSKSSVWLVKADCQTTPRCKPLNLNGLRTVEVDFEDKTDNRADLDLLAADNIIIKLTSASNTMKSISEIIIQGRCHCYGNVISCEVKQGDYDCSCDRESNTTGDHCDECKDGYFRTQYNETVCSSACSCIPIGSINNSCEQVGGNCPCKKNVDVLADRKCSVCKHNTVQFGLSLADGCIACDCNKSGIVRCEENRTCTCKTNVEIDSKKCQSCLPDHYGINSPLGCSPCACDPVGSIPRSNDQNCDLTTGQCDCKRKVEGRQCDRCQAGYYDLNIIYPEGCVDCECNFVGTNDNNVCERTALGQCPCIQDVINNRKCIPVLLGMVPDYGPLAGGTLITVFGQLLGKSDSSVNVAFFINGTSQNITSRNETAIKIRTSPSDKMESKPISIVWSKGSKTPFRAQDFERQHTFTYKPNPTVIAPTSETVSYASGGCSLGIYGEHLESVYQPQLLVHIDQHAVTMPSACTHKSSGEIKCLTPNVTRYTTSGQYEFGVGLDNVRDFTSLSSAGSRLVVVPDPQINSEDVKFTNTFDKTLTIKGKDLTKACLATEDLMIKLGDHICTITERTDDHIVCDPEEAFPGTSRDVDAMVHIGALVVNAGTVSMVSFWMATYFLIGVGSLVGLIVIILGIVFYCKLRTWRKKDKQASVNIPFKELEPKGGERSSNPYDNPVAMVRPISDETSRKEQSKNTLAQFIKALKMDVGKVVKSSVVERSHVEAGNRCTHKGTHTRIINGQFTGSSSSPFAGDNLTIKTLVKPYKEHLQDGLLSQWLNDGLRDCTRLQDFRHDNLIHMMGIAVDEKNVYILYPQMTNRTMKDYLKTQEVTAEQKVTMCVEVAEGMKYLETEHIVHKDLAARNCWVTEDVQIKIGDSAFSSDLFPKEYLLQKDRRLPVRWMAPESLKQLGFYSSKSDVWSYGVLIWEIYCDGSYLPYYDITDDTDIKKYVCEDGYTLGKPQECPDEIHNLIVKCNEKAPDNRPDFSAVLADLDHVISPGGTGQASYVNEQELMEDYQNTMFPPRPKRPAKFV